MTFSQSSSRKRAKTGKESDTSSKTKKSSAYDPAFEQHLIDHGIYPHGYNYGDDDGSVYPDNWEEINDRLAQPRPSLLLSRFAREEFRTFEKMNMQALTEGKVMSKVFPIIAGTADIPSQENLPFGKFKDLTNGSITRAQLDFYDRCHPTDLDKNIREKLGPYIIPSTNTTAPCLPNFFMEGKGPNGNTAVCKCQVLYDGALGARGIHEFRSYVHQEKAYDNKAYTITSTYHGVSGTFTLYTTHPAPSESIAVSDEYRMTQLKAFAVTSDPETFRQGASALRNARDWVKEKREELIAAANDNALSPEPSGSYSSAYSFVSPSTEFVQLESETSADELAVDTDTCARYTYKTPVGARTGHSSKISSHPGIGKKSVRINRRSGTHYGRLQET